jgi:hypothetical protein
MRSEEILSTAAKLVSGDRDRTHGNKRDNFQNIARMWNAWLVCRKDVTSELDENDVAAMMALLKLARTQSGLPNADDYVDLAGYAACMGELSTGAALTVIREAS